MYPVQWQILTCKDKCYIIFNHIMVTENFLFFENRHLKWQHNIHLTFSVLCYCSVLYEGCEPNIMGDLHPQYLLSKRYPAHAAIELQDLKTLSSLLSDKIDANFYLERKSPRTELSLLHQACCNRLGSGSISCDIVRISVASNTFLSKLIVLARDAIFL